jgi:uncharacterized protein YigE (DUF2233 family)
MTSPHKAFPFAAKHLNLRLSLLCFALPLMAVSQLFHPSRIQMRWKGADGKPYLYFDAVRKAHPDIRFAMNAGMFTKAYGPVGLYIENGKELRPVKISRNRKVNFGIQPQGVFFIRNGQAAVTSIPCKTTGMTYATQSAPMLVINGKINRNLPQGNLIVRNGVGVRKDGKVFFAVKWMRFREFAQFFIDNQCVNALYLDGGVSEKWEKGDLFATNGGPFGPMIIAF